MNVLLQSSESPCFGGSFHHPSGSGCADSSGSCQDGGRQRNTSPLDKEDHCGGGTLCGPAHSHAVRLFLVTLCNCISLPLFKGFHCMILFIVEQLPYCGKLLRYSVFVDRYSRVHVHVVSEFNFHHCAGVSVHTSMCTYKANSKYRTSSKNSA